MRLRRGGDTQHVVTFARVDNPQTIFANADAAFMVAYSIIMLTTDLVRAAYLCTGRFSQVAICSIVPKSQHRRQRRSPACCAVRVVRLACRNVNPHLARLERWQQLPGRVYAGHFPEHCQGRHHCAGRGPYERAGRRRCWVRMALACARVAYTPVREREKAQLYRTETSMAVKRSVAMLQSSAMSGNASRFVAGENHQLARCRSA